MSECNLLDQPWIPCRKVDGTLENVGIRDALNRASEFAELRDQSPLVTAALYRLLLAILHRVYDGPRNQAEWFKIWNAERFDETRLNGYFKKWGTHFDLFDDKHPFYQDSTQRGEALKPTTYLAPLLPTDTNIAHWRHSQDEQSGLCPACLAKGLVQVPAFATAGGRGFPGGINDVPPVYFFLKQDNLFGSLALNLLIQPQLENDVPAWEGPASTNGPIGLCEGLTWQPRRILISNVEPGSCSLCGETALGVSKTMVYRAGRSRSEERTRAWSDPVVRIADLKKQSAFRPPNPQKSKYGFPSFWLAQTHSIIDAFTSNNATPPVLHQAAKLLQSSTLQMDGLNLETVSLHSDGKAKNFYATLRHWSFPTAFAIDENARKSALELLAGIESTLEVFWKKRFAAGHRQVLAESDQGFLRTHCEKLAEESFLHWLERRDNDETLHKFERELNTIPFPGSSLLFKPQRESVTEGFLQFVNRLRDLGAADLSLLRKVTMESPGKNVQAFDLFTEIFWDLRKSHKFLERESCWLVSTLYPWNTLNSRGTAITNLGEAMRKALGNDERARHRAVQRFGRMLVLERGNLAATLADALRELRRRRIGVSWPHMLQDLSHWNDEDRHVQRGWALGFKMPELVK